jgi:hypothetical protein
MPKEFEGSRPAEVKIGREISLERSPTEILNSPEQPKKERQPGDSFDKKEIETVDDILNYIGETGNVINYITDAKTRETVRGLMEEYSKLDYNDPNAPKKREEIAEKIYRIADEAYDEQS